MKLATWNCARGFEKKKELIFSDEPDIVVIQECSRKSTESSSLGGYDAAWVGRNPNIGLGVFWKRVGWSVRRLGEPTNNNEWVVPFEVTGSPKFTLIAVWACEVRGDKRASYVGQLNRALQENPSWFGNAPVVVAGDFNSNARWDQERRGWNHSTMVAKFQEHGLVSVYHALRDERHGEETTPTFHLLKNRERGFHIDYIFAPEAWKSHMQLSVGNASEWISYSDHSPLTLSLSSETAS